MDKNPINWLPRLHVHEYTKGKNGIEQVFPLSHKADKIDSLQLQAWNLAQKWKL